MAIKPFMDRVSRTAVLVLLILAGQAHAQSIVYQVDRSFNGGTIVGTIETDGATGPLSPGNIVAWSFEAFDGTDTIQFSSSSPFNGLLGDAWAFLTATPTELTFDFDAVNASGLSEKLISFNGGDSNNSYNYNLVGNLPYVIKGEQIIHQFGTSGGEHRIDSPERSVEVIARVEGASMDCSAPSVSLGEVMAGFQAAYTAGSHQEVGPAGEMFLGASGEDRRGFIVPEGVNSSSQCENDFILISGYAGVTIALPDGTPIRTPKEAIDIVNAALNGLIVSQRFEVDGVLVDHMNTDAKIGFMPNGRRAAIITSGVIIEPYTLSQGLHSAVLTYSLDRSRPRDGIPDEDYVLTTTFSINAGPE